MKTSFTRFAKSYHPILDVKSTELAIKQCKDTFEHVLAQKLGIMRVSAPLFVTQDSGLNDTLNGVEKAVSFAIKDIPDHTAEIVHSLAKRKRMALYKYGFSTGEGIYTDMNAIRRDEALDELHSLYVDQRDREKIIDISQRTLDTLKETATKIYGSLQETEQALHQAFPQIDMILPQQLHFITTQELEDLYPTKSPKEREDLICKKYGAVFLMQIGDKLMSGIQHDGRAPDYDDWALNGDILLYYPLLDQAFEISSMGIRVDEESMRHQLTKRGCLERIHFDFHAMVIEKILPYTMGGGIGQSRICMFLLKKIHIGEVQASLRPKSTVELCEKYKIPLL